MAKVLLEVKDLQTYFFLKRGVIKAVDGVSFTLHEGETMGIVGESGSGKSMTVSSIMRLEPSAARIVGGSIIYKGENLVNKTQKQMEKIRGDEIAMIMQDPMASLNPAYITGSQVAECINLHSKKKESKKEVHEEVINAFKKVYIPDPEKRYKNYPHEMSGGMRQRVVGAMALTCEPSLLIADEPTTALDVTIQNSYMENLKEIQKDMGMAMLFITHDLGIVAKMCENVCVMYLGKIVEKGKTLDIWDNPQHKYTEALLKSIPRIEEKVKRLHSIEGQVPPGNAIPPGCGFHPRCPYADERCRCEVPPYVEVEEGHYAACWKASKKNL